MLQGVEMGWRGLSAGGRTPEKYVRDVKQDRTVTPDLLESIMKPTDPIKEELRNILSKMKQVRRIITKSRVCTFCTSGKIMDCGRRPTQPATPTSFKPITAS